MKRSLLLASILIINSSAVFAAPITGNIGVFLGGKSMSDSQWTDEGNQGVLGVVTDFKQEHWPVSIAIDGFVSTNNTATMQQPIQMIKISLRPIPVSYT